MARETIQGSKTSFRCRRYKESSPDSWTELSGNLSGLDNWSFNEEPRTREIPGGGTQIGTQILSYVDTDGSMSMDVNKTNEALYWGGSGRLYEWQATVPFKSGTKTFTWRSFTEINMTAEDAGVLRWNMTMNTDGNIVVS